MMTVLTVGNTEIPYRVRYSEDAKQRRIIVTPGDVEVVVPHKTADGELAGFLHRKRRWVYDQTRKMEELAAERPSVARYITGAKVPFRGRNMRLTVTPKAIITPELEYRNGFHIEVPNNVPPQVADALIESEIRFWMKRRAREDVKAFVKLHSGPHDLKPKTYRIKSQKHIWGSCGRDRVINLNWQLIMAPKPVLEYAVVHELCHLRHRNHSEAFWNLVGGIIPDYKQRKSWLEQNESLLEWNGPPSL
jgi:predicted metal-dependent hydrolase